MRDVAETRLLSLSDLKRVCNVRDARTIMRWYQEGVAGFPAPIIDAGRIKRWHPDDIERWLLQRRQKVA